MSYTHLTVKEKCSIGIYLNEWLNYSEIALKLGRLCSTISRQVKKYKSSKTGKYNACSAIRESKKLRISINKQNKQRIKSDTFLIHYILSKIKKYGSPEQISWRIKEEHNIIISKDTIYLFIYEKHPELIKKYLRRKGERYQNERKDKYQLEDRKIIDSWPMIVEERSRIWDWEWDTVIWIRWWSKEVFLTNVDRKFWYLLARKIDNKSAEAVFDWTLKVFKRIPRYKQKTITYDNGREFAWHKMIQGHTGLDVYFAHTYLSWERWTNENTNWLIRQFTPKKTDFSSVSPKQLQYYVSLINSRPRKRLNYKTPHEVFFDIN